MVVISLQRIETEAGWPTDLPWAAPPNEIYAHSRVAISKTVVCVDQATPEATVYGKRFLAIGLHDPASQLLIIGGAPK